MTMPKLLSRFMLACLFFSISQGYAQAKPTLIFTVVCYIEEQTANYFGGKAAIQDSIIKQMQGVNQIFNSNANFNSLYNFTPVAFKYYKDGDGLDSTLILTQMAPETNYHYRVVYNAFPPANINYRVAYDAAFESIIFSYDNAVYGNGNIFGRIMTKTLAHEFGHSRGAYDLYAGNINGNQNSVNSNLGWSSPEASLMNVLFSENGWDTQSTYMINKTATIYGAHTFTWDQWQAIGNAAFPQTVGVSVAGGNGWPIPNATVKFFGIPWIRDNNTFVLPTTPTYTLTTDNGGLAKFTNNNPFVLNAGNLPLYHTFFVTVTYGSETK